MLISYLAYSLILKMEVIYSSETLVNFQWTTQRYILEDKILLEPKSLLLCSLVPILRIVFYSPSILILSFNLCPILSSGSSH
jgi:hypothetical protein